jgi:hypothetical protein
MSDEVETCPTCRRMQQEAPKAYKRMKRAALAKLPSRDLGIIHEGYRIAEGLVNEHGAKNILRQLKKPTTHHMRFELSLRPTQKLSSGDWELLHWATEHGLIDFLGKHELLANPRGAD